MAQQLIPDPARGRQAIESLAKLLALGLLGTIACVGALVCTIIGGASLLLGGGATLLWTAAGCAATGVTALGTSALRAKYIGRRDAAHINAWSQQAQQDEQKNGAAASPLATPHQQPDPIGIVFNPEAAVRLKKDIKMMRPIKISAKAEQPTL